LADQNYTPQTGWPAAPNLIETSTNTTSNIIKAISPACLVDRNYFVMEQNHSIEGFILRSMGKRDRGSSFFLSIWPHFSG